MAVKYHSHPAFLLALALLLLLPLLLAACLPRPTPPDQPPNAAPAAAPLDEQQAADLAWQALDPNTSSHDRSAWQTSDVRQVTGREVADRFDGDPVPGGCAPGPAPPDNAPVAPADTYWYVLMQPLPATARPVPTEQYSPTAPPRFPEPFVYEAHFLLDARTGQVVARRLACVIY